MNQEQAEQLIKTIYTPEKKELWQSKMNILGDKFMNEEITYDQYMNQRRKLRKELGFPA